jgi:hypothetical protein
LRPDSLFKSITMKVSRSEFIEITIPAGYASSRVTIGDQSNLRNVKTQSVLAQSLTMSIKSFNGLPLLNATAFKSAYLVLCDNNSKEVCKIPLVEIETRPESGKRFVELNNLSINWSRSYFQFGDTSAINSGAAETIQLTVYFID